MVTDLEEEMMKVFKNVLLVLGIILVLAGIAFVSYGFYKKLTTDIPNPIATMEVEGYGTIKIELYPDKAPNTVANFIRLANRGFYNGLTYHRTIPDFMIQGGDKSGDGSGSPSLSDIYNLEDVLNDKKVFEEILDTYYGGEYTIEENSQEQVITSYADAKKIMNEENGAAKFEDFLEVSYNIPGEFIANGYEKNNLKHTAGVISMARMDYTQTSSAIAQYGYNSAGSQFFIMTEDNTSLDGLYSAFGKVTEGMDVVEKIANVEVYYRDTELEEGEKAPKDEEGNEIASDTPKEAPVIKSITVETFGVDYGIPNMNSVFDYYSWLMMQYGFQ